ncbi:MAG: hypothetical protein L6Q59_00050 [Ignavibacteriaceae bacterium]|nr:hypothetical protein [Ignavibacteriaceae bacterium]
MQGAEKRSFLLETDIFTDHLIRGKTEKQSALEHCMVTGLCFTTAINAAEIYGSKSAVMNLNIINDIFAAIKILGINSRYVLKLPDFYGKVTGWRDAMFASVAWHNKLTIVTFDNQKYSELNIDTLDVSELKAKI